jgi:hypothetical protein
MGKVSAPAISVKNSSCFGLYLAKVKAGTPIKDQTLKI